MSKNDLATLNIPVAAVCKAEAWEATPGCREDEGCCI